MRPLPVTFNYPFIPLCSGSGSPWCEPDEKCGCFEYEMERNVRITRITTPPMEKDPITGMTEDQWSKLVYALVLTSLAVVFVFGLIHHNPLYL